MSELFKDIPEFVEVRHCKSGTLPQLNPLQVNIGESLAARTDTLGMYTFLTPRCVQALMSLYFTGTFRELGPPDLIHVVKSTGAKSAQREVSQTMRKLG